MIILYVRTTDNSQREGASGVMSKALDYNLEVEEFEPQLSYSVHFRVIIKRKSIKAPYTIGGNQT